MRACLAQGDDECTLSKMRPHSASVKFLPRSSCQEFLTWSGLRGFIVLIREYMLEINPLLSGFKSSIASITEGACNSGKDLNTDLMKLLICRYLKKLVLDKEKLCTSSSKEQKILLKNKSFKDLIPCSSHTRKAASI